MLSPGESPRPGGTLWPRRFGLHMLDFCMFDVPVGIKIQITLQTVKLDNSSYFAQKNPCNKVQNILYIHKYIIYQFKYIYILFTRTFPNFESVLPNIPQRGVSQPFEKIDLEMGQFEDLSNASGCHCFYNAWHLFGHVSAVTNW